MACSEFGADPPFVPGDAATSEDRGSDGGELDGDAGPGKAPVNLLTTGDFETGCRFDAVLSGTAVVDVGHGGSSLSCRVCANAANTAFSAKLSAPVNLPGK